MNPDLINAGFNFIAGFFILNNCRVLLRQKLVRGVSVISVTFYLLWGIWNIFWFQYLDTPWSFYAGLFEMLSNCLWIGLMLYFNFKEKRAA